jgi:hypothetical protein
MIALKNNSSHHHHQDTNQTIKLPTTLSDFIKSHPAPSNTSSEITLAQTPSQNQPTQPSIKMHSRRHNATVTKTTKPTLSMSSLTSSLSTKSLGTWGEDRERPSS